MSNFAGSGAAWLTTLLSCGGQSADKLQCCAQYTGRLVERCSVGPEKSITHLRAVEPLRKLVGRNAAVTEGGGVGACKDAGEWQDLTSRAG